MGKNEHEEIIAFDTLYTTNHIAMLKVLMPYFDTSFQQHLAIYIKFLELQYTLSLSRPHELRDCSSQKKEFDIKNICSDILPFCTESEKRTIEQIRGLFHSMEMYKEMSQVMNVMQDIMPSNMSSDSSFDFSSILTALSNTQSDKTENGMMDMLMGMLSPEQKNLFEMFGGNNTHESK